jgi:signal transduction histidine kinase
LNCEDAGMQSSSDIRAQHQQLRRLAVEDPRRARDRFLEILDSNSAGLEPLLELLSSPGEGRLRQIIANSVRSLPAKERLIPFLIRWRDNETDEFAFRAINAALADSDLTGYIRSHDPPSLVDPEIVKAYRYASDRLCHRVRNVLLKPAAKLIRIRTVVNSVTDEKVRGDLHSIIGELSDDLQSIDRIVESLDVDPEHFRVRPIALADWVVAMNKQYSRQFSAVKLTVETDEVVSALTMVRGSDHLLETIFWNLWINAQQTVGEDCRITVRLTRTAGAVEVITLDNGDGFLPALQGIAFQEAYSSSKSSHRGRGLLEIQDAVERLHGSVGLAQQSSGEFRIRIVLPVENQ